MKMYMKNIPVNDQAVGLAFYTEKLGFNVKHDIPLGEHRWLTVTSPEEPDGVELGLEPSVHPATIAYKEALVADGIPISAFQVDDIEAEVRRLESLDVSFIQPPVKAGGAIMAVFDDTCGNLIQLIELVE
ncbi:MAG: VOC family protein [Thalassospira sp.]|uniref:VOC family protein n=1 Tax=Thalassospira sp. TaxID=1912094 RepID=UPI003A8B12A7